MIELIECFLLGDSAIEVLRKMLEPDFSRRLKASGFVERVYVVFRKAEAGDGDRVRLLDIPVRTSTDDSLLCRSWIPLWHFSSRLLCETSA